MNRILLVALLLLSVARVYSQDLPHKMTDREKELMKTFIPYVSPLDYTTPPGVPVRTMAEWEELDGLMITWTSYTSILRQIVRYAQEECTVLIVCSDSNSVKTFLQNGGVPLTNLKFFIAPFNSVWCRDYGPWSVYSYDADSLYIIDWIYNRPRANDDAIPAVFANREGLPLYQTTTAPYNLIHTGGNFMADGNGTGFSSKLILTENPSQTSAAIDTIMKRFMGIRRFIKMETLPFDQIHHIDMHMKLLNEETLLVGEYPAGVADGPQIEANLQYILNNFKTCYGRDYKVVRIPMPPDAQGRYPSNGGDYRTFTNSVIVNKTVIVPTYELKHDTSALRIYREAMPGYRVVGIDCNQTITALGAIHCIVKEVGRREPVFISHAPIRTLAGRSDPYLVKAYIKTRTGVGAVSLWWSADTAQGFNALPMIPSGADTFVARIPAQPLGTKVFYYIAASSNSGRSVMKPLTAPRGAYSFVVDNSPCVNITAVAGWNLVSVPLAASNMNTVSLFPAANSSAYFYNNGYHTASLLENAKGYWLRFPSSSVTPVCGAAVSGGITLNAGWNLIGGYAADIPISSTTTAPPGIITSQFYGYENGYVAASSLAAGKGYWVRSSQSGTLNLPAVNAGEKNNFPVTKASAGAIELAVFDNSGNRSSLLVFDTERALSLFDLPPPAPDNAFDVRFSSQRMAAHRGEFPARISAQGVNFPLRIQAKGGKIGLRCTRADGRIMEYNLQEGASLELPADAALSMEILSAERASGYVLEQNFPNPFNPSTHIAFHLAAKQYVNLKVYSQLGEEVITLLNEEMSPGRHTVQFDASRLSAGIYIYRLTAGHYSAAKTMVLLK